MMHAPQRTMLSRRKKKLGIESGTNIFFDFCHFMKSGSHLWWWQTKFHRGFFANHYTLFIVRFSVWMSFYFWILLLKFWNYQLISDSNITTIHVPNSNCLHVNSNIEKNTWNLCFKTSILWKMLRLTLRQHSIYIFGHNN